MTYQELYSILTSVVLLFLLVYSYLFQLQFGVNLFNFITVLIFIFAFLSIFVSKSEIKMPKKSKGVRYFNIVCRITLIFWCAAAGMFWQGALWVITTLFLYNERLYTNGEEK